MKKQIVLFGATGYTGQLTARAMVDRGLEPLLVGRDKERLLTLSKELGNLPFGIADVEEPLTLERLVKEGDVLVSTVGPFTRYGKTAIEVAIKKGAAYFDSTGEHSFIEKVFHFYHSKAVKAGIPLITAFGYDYVPGHCVGTAAMEMAGSEAVFLDIGYFVTTTGLNRKAMSDGTFISIFNACLEPGLVWNDGKLCKEFAGRYFKRFSIDGSLKKVVSVCGSEHFALPESYPQLQTIKTYIGWFKIFSYPMFVISRINSLMFKVPTIQKCLRLLVGKALHSSRKGPDVNNRRDTGSHIVGIACNDKKMVLAKAELRGINGYSFTANMLAWGADIAAQDKINKVGALGPVEAFGFEGLKGGCKQAGLELYIG